MKTTDEDWNYDRMHSAFSFISEVQADMMRGLHKSEVSDFVRDRMVLRLKLAAEQLSMLKLHHEECE